MSKPEPRRPRICLLSRFFDLRNGGIGRFSQKMFEGLTARGYEVVAVASSHSTDAGYLLYTAAELAARIPRGCDVYHCLTPLEALYAPKQCALVTFHDLIPLLHLDKTDTHYTEGAARQVRKAFSKYYFRMIARRAARCAMVVCNSEQTRNEVVTNLGVPAEKTAVVRLGIAPGLGPGPKMDGRFRIGTLSYLDQRKRIDLLIKAFLSADVDGQLVIGGSGNDAGRLKSLARGDPRIIFSGFVPEDKMVEFYNNLDLFVFPSRIEGYGLPIVEAFACGKPVVVLADSIIPDEVKSRCIVVEDLKECFSLGKRPGESIAANLAFAALHTWESCVEQYVGIYERVLRQTRQRRDRTEGGTYP